jgi:outer membrane receptor protein involved in Fe transport
MTAASTDCFRSSCRVLLAGFTGLLLAAGGFSAPASGQEGNAESDQPPEIEEFVVVASPAEAIMQASRIDADELINTLNAEEFSKFAASDVADALKFVPGVNVVEGQFAIIRGLEDRYSSTLFNFAPVPSPDPDSQSPQLDLFPSEIVSNLVVAKTFGPDLPSNSSGGSINILTQDYPEEFELKLSTGSGLNSSAWDRFLRFDDGSPVGQEVDGSDTIESESGASVGGRGEFLGRGLRYKALFNREIDYETGEGYQEGREPRAAQSRPFPRPPVVTRSGDLSLGELSLSAGRFDLTESERAEQTTAYLGLGTDLDQEGSHRIDSSFFYTRKKTEVVQLKENGSFPNLDYGRLVEAQLAGEPISESYFDGFATPGAWMRSVRDEASSTTRGPLWLDSFQQSQSFDTERDLWVHQMNGDHHVDQIEGLHFSWAANHAKTTQTEAAKGVQYAYEGASLNIPTEFPVSVEGVGTGVYLANDGIFVNDNDIEEKQNFARFDVDYEFTPLEPLTLQLNSGVWYEHANRDVASSFLQQASVGGSTQFAIRGETPQELGENLFIELDQGSDGTLGGSRDTTNESSRKIKAWNLGAKATLWEQLDLLGGLRGESIFIESLNDPFTGEFDPQDGTPKIFPSAYLFFDRRDNPAREFETPPAVPGTVFNDEILGIEVPIDPITGLVDLSDRAAIDSLLNGEIDETFLFPTFGVAYRPIEGLSLRGAYSQTVARPSFREMGYYVSVEPATDDLLIGNPQLGLSEVESFDARAEYTWGGLGDLAAASAFYKRIQDPIESIVVRDPTNFDQSSNALYRTFFNNPNEATLWGIELEARKYFDFVGFDFAQYVSLGGNFTYIDATVGRTDAELARSQAFFGVASGDEEQFVELDPERRLFGQPKWIANADLTFQHPDWGTKATLAVFAISNVLDAAGSASIAPDGTITSFTLDRYIDSFYQVDFNLSQTWRIALLRGDVTFKASAKNLTNSPRKIIYDPDQTRNEIAERSLKIGRDLSLSVTYSFSF